MKQTVHFGPDMCLSKMWSVIFFSSHGEWKQGKMEKHNSLLSCINEGVSLSKDSLVQKTQVIQHEYQNIRNTPAFRGHAVYANACQDTACSPKSWHIIIHVQMLKRWGGGELIQQCYRRGQMSPAGKVWMKQPWKWISNEERKCICGFCANVTKTPMKINFLKVISTLQKSVILKGNKHTHTPHIKCHDNPFSG